MKSVAGHLRQPWTRRFRAERSARKEVVVAAGWGVTPALVAQQRDVQPQFSVAVALTLHLATAPRSAEPDSYQQPP